jgi:hypothetical protein
MLGAARAYRNTWRLRISPAFSLGTDAVVGGRAEDRSRFPSRSRFPTQHAAVKWRVALGSFEDEDASALHLSR